MIHIKTPVELFPHWAQTDIRDSDGTVLVSCASGHEGEIIAGEIKRALDEHNGLVAQRDALVTVADGLYDTVQDLRRMINAALRDDGSGPVLDDVMSRGREHIKAYRAALAAAEGEIK